MRPLLLAVLVAACGPTAYQRVSRADTADAYRAFLRTDPEESEADSARERLAELELDGAKAAHTILGYKRFLEEFPNSSQAPVAKALLETLRYTTALNKGTAQAYRQFLVEHPDGAHAAEAAKRLADLEFKAVATLDDPQTLSALIAERSEDARRPIAEARLDDVSFKRAAELGTLALLQYLTDFPAGAHRDEVRVELLARQLEGLLFSGEIEAAVALAAKSPLASRVEGLSARIDRAAASQRLARAEDPVTQAATPEHYLRDLDDVARALHAPDPLDRWQAAEELGQHVSIRAIDPLLDAVTRGRHPLVRERALESLSGLLSSLPARVVDYEVGSRVTELRPRAESPEVQLAVAVLFDLGGRLADASPWYQRAFDPATPDPVILRRWVHLRQDRRQHYAAAVAARQLGAWAAAIAQDHPTGAGGEASLFVARQICAAADAARFASQAISDAGRAGTDFPEDIADFQRGAEAARQLSEARLRDAELALSTQDPHALGCADGRVADRLKSGQLERERALKALRAQRPKAAKALLQLAAARDPSPALRQLATAELGSLP